jgi:hypothetical protein
LQNNISIVLIDPVQTNDVLMRHSVRDVMIRIGQMNIQRARQAQDAILRAAVLAGIYMDAQMKLLILQKEISQGELTANIEVPVEINDSEKTQFSNDWRTILEWNVNLINH